MKTFVVYLFSNNKNLKERIMSRESKIIQATIHSAQKTISHYESFGWELLSLNGAQITMSRETQNPVYSELVKNQAKYEELMLKYASIINPPAPEKPAEFKLGTCLILLLLAVVPGALYIAYKVKKHNEYKAALAAHQKTVADNEAARNGLKNEMEKVALDSRATFFGKQG